MLVECEGNEQNQSLKQFLVNYGSQRNFYLINQDRLWVHFSITVLYF